jgi:hypothetical protein
MELVEEFQHEGLTVQIFYDDMPESPREWDNFGRLALKHDRYDMPNEADIDIHGYDSWNEVEAALRHEYGALVILPVSMYDHSGVHIYAGNNGMYGAQIGFTYCTREDILNNWGSKRVTQKQRIQAEALLTAEVETYSDYSNGNVYGYVILDEDGEELDSCWGIYGYDYAVSAAKDIAHYTAKQPPKRKIAKYATEVHA